MENIAALAEVLKLALDGQIKRGELDGKLRIFSDGNVFVETLSAGLDEAVTHTPFHLLSGRMDVSMWHGMREYHVILCDYLLLPYYDGDSQGWLSLRSKLLDSVTRMKQVDEDSIKQEIAKMVSA